MPTLGFLILKKCSLQLLKYAFVIEKAVLFYVKSSAVEILFTFEQIKKGFDCAQPDKNRYQIYSK